MFCEHKNCWARVNPALAADGHLYCPKHTEKKTTTGIVAQRRGQRNKFIKLPPETRQVIKPPEKDETAAIIAKLMDDGILPPLVSEDKKPPRLTVVEDAAPNKTMKQEVAERLAEKYKDSKWI